MLEVGPELGDLRRRIPLEREGRVILRPARSGQARRRRGRRLGPRARAGRARADRSGDGHAEAARGRPRRLVVDRGRPRRRLARRPRRREEARRAHGTRARKHGGGRRCSSRRTTSIAVGRDAVWFVGESSARLWHIHPDTVSIVDSDPIGQSPSAVAVDEDGAVWVASSSLSLALAPANPRRTTSRASSSARPRAASSHGLRPDLDQPRRSRQASRAHSVFRAD